MSWSKITRIVFCYDKKMRMMVAAFRKISGEMLSNLKRFSDGITVGHVKGATPFCRIITRELKRKTTDCSLALFINQ